MRTREGRRRRHRWHKARTKAAEWRRWSPERRRLALRIAELRWNRRTEDAIERATCVCLFRGGPFDGQRIRVHDGAQVWRLIVHEPMAVNPFEPPVNISAKVATYERKRFAVPRGWDRYGQRIIDNLPDEYHYLPQ